MRKIKEIEFYETKQVLSFSVIEDVDSVFFVG